MYEFGACGEFQLRRVGGASVELPLLSEARAAAFDHIPSFNCAKAQLSGVSHDSPTPGSGEATVSNLILDQLPEDLALIDRRGDRA